jgi:hypothetical protein
MGSPPRNLALAGGLVILAISTAFAAAVLLPRIPWTPRAKHRIEFPLAPGIGPLAVGSTVEAAGLADGRVVAIALGRSRDDLPAEDVVAVTIEFEGPIALPASVEARIVKPLVGSGAAIELLGLDAAGPRLAPGAAIRAAPPREMLESMLGRERTAMLRQAIARGDAIGEFVDRLREEVPPRIEAIRGAFESLQPPIGDRVAAWGQEWPPIAAAPAEARNAWRGIGEEWAAVRERWQAAQHVFEGTRNSFATFGPAAGGNLREIGVLRELDGHEGAWLPQLPRLVATFDRLDRGFAAMLRGLDGFAAEVQGQWRLSAAQFSLVGGLFAEFQSEIASDLLSLISAWLAVESGALPTPEIEQAIAQDAAMQSLLQAMESLRAAELAIARLAEDPAASAAGVTVPPEVPAAMRAAVAEAREAARRLFERIMRTVGTPAPQP